MVRILLMIAAGALVAEISSIIIWKIRNITDGPWWVGLFIFVFIYSFFLPVLIVPYLYFSKSLENHYYNGIISSFLSSLLYFSIISCVLSIIDANLGALVRLWYGVILLLITSLSIGALASYYSIKIELKLLKKHN